MNGDHKSDAPEAGWRYSPADNPPSLTEPSHAATHVSDDELRKQLVATAVVPTESGTPEPADTPGSGSQAEAGSPAELSTMDAPAADASGDQTSVGVGIGIDPVVPAAATAGIQWESSGDELQAVSSNWRVRMSALSVIAGALIYLLTRDIISSIAVALVGLVFGFLGSRKPPSLHYSMDRRGVTIGVRYYSYDQFRAFSVIDDAIQPTIDLVPLRRFSPILSLHFDVQQRDLIVALLADNLPMELPQRDAIDSIVRRIKF